MEVYKTAKTVVTGTLTLDHTEIDELTYLLSKMDDHDFLMSKCQGGSSNAKKFCEKIVRTFSEA